MASSSEDDWELRTLNWINNTLDGIPANQIAQRALIQLTQQLSTCPTIFTSPESSSKNKSEIGVAIHRFKTKLSSLLNERSVEGRYAAVVLIKAAIEVGGWEMLKDCKGWVHGLIAILKKPDPPATKNFAMITLTRVFELSKDYPTLTREVTTPSMQPFIQACLNHFKDNDAEWAIQQTLYQREILETMLQCFSELIPRHPTVFRSYVTQIRAIAILLTSQNSFRVGNIVTSWTTPVTTRTMQLGQRVFVQLHTCAPKNGAAEEWNVTHELLLHGIHEVANEIFRAINETWTSDSDMSGPRRTGQDLSNHPCYLQADALGNTAWSGLAAGVERMISLLGLLQQYIATPTFAPVSPKLGLICSLLTRLFSLTVPRAADHLPGFNMFNKQVSRQEREELFAALPKIHIAAINILKHIILRFGASSMPMCPIFLDQLVWVFDREYADMALRETTYETMVEVLTIIAPTLNDGKLAQLETLIQRCSSDAILSAIARADKDSSAPTARTSKINGAGSAVQAEMVMETASPRTASATAYDSLDLAARNLISAMLSRVPAEKITQSMRDALDRAAVLSGDSGALTASALNPPPLRSSILPVMAAVHPSNPHIESILRPRMPPIFTGAAVSTTDISAPVQLNGFNTSQKRKRDEEDEVSAEEEVRRRPNINTESTRPVEHFAPGNGAEQPVHPRDPSDSSQNVSISVESVRAAHQEAPRTGAAATSATTAVPVTTPDGSGLAALEAAIEAASPEVQHHNSEVVDASEESTMAQGVHSMGAPSVVPSIVPEQQSVGDVDMLQAQPEERETLHDEAGEHDAPQVATDVEDDSSDFEIPPLVFREDVLRDHDAV